MGIVTVKVSWEHLLARNSVSILFDPPKYWLFLEAKLLDFGLLKVIVQIFPFITLESAPWVLQAYACSCKQSPVGAGSSPSRIPNYHPQESLAWALVYPFN